MASSQTTMASSTGSSRTKRCTPLGRLIVRRHGLPGSHDRVHAAAIEISTVVAHEFIDVHCGFREHMASGGQAGLLQDSEGRIHSQKRVLSKISSLRRFGG